MLTVCHDSASIVLPFGCSGIWGSWSCMAPWAHPIILGPEIILGPKIIWVCNYSTVGVVPLVCSGFWGPWSRMGHMGHLWNRTKCYFSYRLNGTMLRVHHDSAPVVLPSGCSGILGPRSQGHMGHFMKSCKMLLLLQIVWYNVLFYNFESSSL